MSSITLKEVLDLVSAAKMGQAYIRNVKRNLLLKAESVKSKAEAEKVRNSLKGVMSDLKRINCAIEAMEGVPVDSAFRITKSLVCASCGDPESVCACSNPVLVPIDVAKAEDQ